MSAEVTRPPEDGDIALPEAKAQFGAGAARYVLPDDDGVEGVAHEGVACELRESYHGTGAGNEPHPHELTPTRSGALLRGYSRTDDPDPANPRTGCEGLPTQQRTDHRIPWSDPAHHHGGS